MFIQNKVLYFKKSFCTLDHIFFKCVMKRKRDAKRKEAVQLLYYSRKSPEQWLHCIDDHNMFVYKKSKNALWKKYTFVALKMITAWMIMFSEKITSHSVFHLLGMNMMKPMLIMFWYQILIVITRLKKILQQKSPCVWIFAITLSVHNHNGSFTLLHITVYHSYWKTYFWIHFSLLTSIFLQLFFLPLAN